MINLYDFLQNQRVEVTTLDELHLMQEVVRVNHPEADLEYINDEDWEEYPVIGVTEDDGNLYFVGYWHSNNPEVPVISIAEFMLVVHGEEDPADEIDFSSIL